VSFGPTAVDGLLRWHWASTVRWAPRTWRPTKPSPIAPGVMCAAPVGVNGHHEPAVVRRLGRPTRVAGASGPSSNRVGAFDAITRGRGRDLGGVQALQPRAAHRRRLQRRHRLEPFLRHGLHPYRLVNPYQPQDYPMLLRRPPAAQRLHGPPPPPGRRRALPRGRRHLPRLTRPQPASRVANLASATARECGRIGASPSKGDPNDH